MEKIFFKFHGTLLGPQGFTMGQITNTPSFKKFQDFLDSYVKLAVEYEENGQKIPYKLSTGYQS